MSRKKTSDMNRNPETLPPESPIACTCRVHDSAGGTCSGTAQTSPLHALVEACNREDGICGLHPSPACAGKRLPPGEPPTSQHYYHIGHIQVRRFGRPCSVRVTILPAPGLPRKPPSQPPHETVIQPRVAELLDVWTPHRYSASREARAR